MLGQRDDLLVGGQLVGGQGSHPRESGLEHRDARLDHAPS
jgi:hypothetical protein